MEALRPGGPGGAQRRRRRGREDALPHPGAGRDRRARRSDADIRAVDVRLDALGRRVVHRRGARRSGRRGPAARRRRTPRRQRARGRRRGAGVRHGPRRRRDRSVRGPVRPAAGGWRSTSARTVSPSSTTPTTPTPTRCTPRSRPCAPSAAGPADHAAPGRCWARCSSWASCRGPSTSGSAAGSAELGDRPARRRRPAEPRPSPTARPRRAARGTEVSRVADADAAYALLQSELVARRRRPAEVQPRRRPALARRPARRDRGARREGRPHLRSGGPDRGPARDADVHPVPRQARLRPVHPRRRSDVAPHQARHADDGRRHHHRRGARGLRSRRTWPPCSCRR